MFVHLMFFSALVCRDTRLRFPSWLSYFLLAGDGSRPEGVRLSIYELWNWCFPLTCQAGRVEGLVGGWGVVGRADW